MEEITGIIKGYKEDDHLYNQYMMSIFNPIQEEILLKYPKELKEYYIYTNYIEISHEFKVYIKFNSKSKINPRENDIYFLITINDSYPKNPPIVHCLSNFSFPSLNDCRNFQTELIPNWKSNNTISDLIEKIPELLYNMEEEYKYKILCIYGSYSKSEKYNINDFIINKSNTLFKVKKAINVENKQELLLENKYFLITDIHILIFNIGDYNFKNECKLEFYGEIMNIIIVNDFQIENQKDNFLDAINLEWSGDCTNKFKDTIIVDFEDKANIIELIMTKKAQLMSKFDLFLSNSQNDINSLYKVIEVKKNILEKNPNDITFRTITDLYQQIIEKYSEISDDGYDLYINKFHDIIKKYEEMKQTKK